MKHHSFPFFPLRITFFTSPAAIHKAALIRNLLSILAQPCLPLYYYRYGEGGWDIARCSGRDKIEGERGKTRRFHLTRSANS